MIKKIEKNDNHWIGKVVSFESQQDQTSGTKAWGIRYKVRIMGDYSVQDGVEDKDVIYAISALPVTAGSGGKGMLTTSRIAQGDTVMGIFMGEDGQAPVIQFVLPRATNEEHGPGKFDPKSGFTKQTVPGLLGRQEFNEQDNVSTPGLKDCKGSQKGGGQGRTTPTKALQKMGIDPKLPAQLNAIKKPPIMSEAEELISNIQVGNSDNISERSGLFRGGEVIEGNLSTEEAGGIIAKFREQRISDLVDGMKGEGNSAAYNQIESVKGPLDNRQRFLIKEKMRIEDLAVDFVNTNTGADKDFDTLIEARESPEYAKFMDQVKVIDEELNN